MKLKIPAILSVPVYLLKCNISKEAVDVVKKELSFQVVNMSKGDVLIGEAGTEIILRMGTAEIIATEKGGLADLTSGTDLANGTNMPANHHLVIPVDDGRGIKAKNKVIVMVKGDFTLE